MKVVLDSSVMQGQWLFGLVIRVIEGEMTMSETNRGSAWLFWVQFHDKVREIANGASS
jgi:hypothetical protein